ncbi:hypothetical protein FV228_11940 [Methylobacterium sp. WL18]|nr:hypothetical protein FV233_22180 [Methylobacterium sp. WL7]TXN71035.1 hypothetical protein FV228_11940 [Methylobacterium sp. WL18]
MKRGSPLPRQLADLTSRSAEGTGDTAALPPPQRLPDPRIGVGRTGAGWSAGPLSRAGEVCSRREPGEGSGLSGEVAFLTPTLSRTGEGAGRAPSRAAVSVADV